ncbi:hypothetical protein ACFSTD_00400 [Novosphingobium colocasiae]
MITIDYTDLTLFFQAADRNALLACKGIVFRQKKLDPALAQYDPLKVFGTLLDCRPLPILPRNSIVSARSTVCLSKSAAICECRRPMTRKAMGG